MPVALVSNVGSATSTASTTVVTVPAGGVAAGNVVIVRASRGDQTATATVADTGGNTYTRLDIIVLSTYVEVLFVAAVTVALVSGNTITVTWTTMGGQGAVVDEFSGATATEDGTSATSTATGTAPSVTMTPATAGLVVTGILVKVGSADGFTEDADTTNGTWVTGTSVIHNSTGINRGAHKILSASGAQTYNPTLGTSREYGAVIAAITATAGPYSPSRVVMAPGLAVRRSANW